MATGGRFGRALRDLRRGLREASSALEVLDVACSAATATIGADVWCGVMLDPSTLLDTGGQHREGFPEETMPRLFEIEHVEQDDVDNVRALARRPDPVSLLSTSTRGALGTSKYFREILQPLGLADELRVVLRQDAHVWGLVVMCRSAGSPPFTEDDLEVARLLADPATGALRRSLLLNGTDPGTVADATGLVMLDQALEPMFVSATAKRWLDDLPEDRPHARAPLPYAVRALAAHSATASPSPARSRVLTRSGRWAALHAWRVDTAGSPTTAVSVGPAGPGEFVPIVLDAYGLTAREREVTQQVLLGASTAQISALLHISEYTVQDHLKAVFDKTGLRSRRDLIGTLFTRHYLPQLADPSHSTDGRLLDPRPAAPPGP